MNREACAFDIKTEPLRKFANGPMARQVLFLLLRFDYN